MIFVALILSFILGLSIGAYGMKKFLELGFKGVKKEYDFVKKK